MNRKGRKEMAIFITGDTHGDFSRLLPAGSDIGLGPSGREFESPISDQNPLKSPLS